MFDGSAGLVETILIMAACIVWLSQQAVGAVKGNGKKLGRQIDELSKTVVLTGVRAEDSHKVYRREMMELRNAIKELIMELRAQKVEK